MKYMLSLAPLALLAASAPADEPLEIPAHRADIFSLAFSPDGKTLATPGYARVGVFGSQGLVEAREAQHVDPGGTTHCYVRRRGDKEQTRHDHEPAGPVRAGYEHWADAVAGRIPYRFTNEQRLGNVAVLEAVVRSAESRKPETVVQYA